MAGKVVAIGDRDARSIGVLYKKARGSVTETAHYLLETGRALLEKKASMSHGEWMPWLADNADVLGFESRSTASRLVQLAISKCSVNAPFANEEASAIISAIWGNGGAPVRGTAGTGENEWYTPPEYIAMAREVLGDIDLDPASSRAAQKIVGAKVFYTKADDGLTKEWHGRVWMNPPYSQPDIARFVSKMVTEVRAARVTAAIMLTHNYTDTAWFHENAGTCDAICFTRGRVKFLDADGETCAPTQGQAFSYFGEQAELFVEVFSRIGFVVVKNPWSRK